MRSRIFDTLLCAKISPPTRVLQGELACSSNSRTTNSPLLSLPFEATCTPSETTEIDPASRDLRRLVDTNFVVKLTTVRVKFDDCRRQIRQIYDEFTSSTNFLSGVFSSKNSDSAGSVKLDSRSSCQCIYAGWDPKGSRGPTGMQGPGP